MDARNFLPLLIPQARTINLTLYPVILYIQNETMSGNEMLSLVNETIQSMNNELKKRLQFKLFLNSFKLYISLFHVNLERLGNHLRNQGSSLKPGY